MRLTRIHQIAAKMGDLAKTRAFYQDVVSRLEKPGD
jgi:catechol 2,3-dioxygenase-like lactoylglutathione lyase family enzyme